MIVCFFNSVNRKTSPSEVATTVARKAKLATARTAIITSVNLRLNEKKYL